MSERFDKWHVGTRFATSALVVVVVAVTSGCGSGVPMARLSGKVSFQGQPVAEGLIVLSNPQLGVYITAPILAGVYEVKTANHGVPPGEYAVAITPPLVDHPVGPILERPKSAAFPHIPTRYRDEKTSGFTAQLQQGDNLVDFDMTK